MSSPSLTLSLWMLVLGLLLGNCGVNSGNPTGKTPTTASIYLQTASLPAGQSLKLRVRGLQLVDGDIMKKPDDSTSETIAFAEIKVIDLSKGTQGDLIPLIEGKAIKFRDYRQVRLLLDPTHAGSLEQASGTNKIVHVLPIDLFAQEQGLGLPSGGRQSDQLAMISGQSMLKEGQSNKLSIGLAWPEAMVEPQALSSDMSRYFLQEKGLAQQAIDQSMFILPMQVQGTTIVIQKD